MDVESRSSLPDIAPSRIAASSTSFVSGPAWSSDDAKAIMPTLETRPYGGFTDTVPQHEAGCLIEPRVSVPSEAAHRDAATAAAEPPGLPPGAPSRAPGVRGV